LKRAIGYVGLYRIARKILNKHKIDIIDGHWIGSGGVVSYLLKKPYIVTEHGLFCESIEKEGLSKKEIEFSKKVLNNAKLIITESFNLKDCIEKFTKNKVEVIHYGIDLSLFRPQKENIFKKPTFLSVGSLNKRKNHIDLLKAFKIVVYLGNDVNLVIIGRDEGEKENLKNFIKNNKLTKKVKIIDGVKNENLPLYYSSAVAFILPSLHEGFGIVFIEAMACGCPVIANNLYAVPEAVGNGGILVEPRNIKQLADAMERILIDKKLRKELSRKAIKQAKKFDIEKRIDKIEEIYQQYIKIYGNYMD
jgi:glycosyltransferase involved in cell wall biosynthesis